jgi:hypothetical protein
MIIPDEFRALARSFYQGSDSGFASIEEWVASAIASLVPQQKKVVRVFLSELLSGKHSDVELERMWDNSGTDYYITGHGGVRLFLTKIHERL